ncbi:hypothetical protein BO78DRAFT_395330 [Aspergillus sclerotiicarbonarius CBS 121057]|uniref:Uncharacterized protein n=1 Tax=Aspergillus sclerotiicarbonarius (strain CBS 121057 / IBT 28362) TaxID=1448318 RepID=A0A319EWM8_ASPSB|nr:hypothetical protein BO78DRAFT_395330 [Aspergillus sclerotiicarbonarius CBS 121057]
MQPHSLPSIQNPASTITPKQLILESTYHASHLYDERYFLWSSWEILITRPSPPLPFHIFSSSFQYNYIP